MRTGQWMLAAAAIAAVGVGGYCLTRLSSPGQDPSPPEPPQSVGFTTPSATTTLAPAPEKPSLRPLIEDLSSADAAKRAAADRLLVDLPPDRRSDLRLALEGLLLPEVEQKLRARLDAMDEEIAVNPPPISLHVHNGDVNAVAAELAMATGTDLGGYIGPFPSGLFTCDVDNKPFWETVAPLNRQAAISMFSYNDRYMLSSAPANAGMEHYNIKGPFILYAMAVTPDQVRMALAADPRTPLVGQQLRYAVIDTQGNVFDIPNSRPAALAERMMPLIDRNIQRATVSLAPFRDANPGATAAGVKVHARLGIALKTASLEVKDIEKNLNVPLPIGDATVTLTSFELRSPKGYGFNFSCRRGNEQVFDTYQLLNASGQVFFSGNSLGGGGVGSGGDAGPGPYTFRVRVVEKLKTMDEEFELKW